MINQMNDSSHLLDYYPNNHILVYLVLVLDLKYFDGAQYMYKDLPGQTYGLKLWGKIPWNVIKKAADNCQLQPVMIKIASEPNKAH